MRKLAYLVVFAGLTTGCGSGSDGTAAIPQTGTDACSLDGQKQFVLDSLYTWYLWNDLLPAGINIGDYASAEELVTRVTLELGPQGANGDPIDLFSSVGSAQADSQFFGEGKFEGFGFSWRFVDQAQTDFRITRTFPGSPADVGLLARGQQVLTLGGRTTADIQADEGVSAFFNNNDTIIFEVQPVNGNAFATTITKDIVTIDPVPQWRIIDTGNGRNVGYMELSTFISTADAELETVFAAFLNAQVDDIVIDLRYNGGGLVSTADLLGDYLGGFIAQNLIFSSTEFNADRADNNSLEFFDIRANSVSMPRLAFIATRSTASASELVINGMIPHADVAIIGDRTFGKPVGQIGLEFCDKILRPTSFKKANADGNGDYFDGLPLSAGCAAADDLSVPVGDDLDPNMIAAMGYLATGACPVTAIPGNQFKPGDEDVGPVVERNQSPQGEFLNAF